MFIDTDTAGVCWCDAVQFYIANIYELEGKHKAAKEAYDQLLNKPDLTGAVRTACLCHLGWMVHSNEGVAGAQGREQVAIPSLEEAIKTDTATGQSWYLLGRLVRVKVE